MNFLFPYMARWKAINWSRYHQLFTRLAQMGHKVIVLQPPPANIKETNFQEIEVSIPDNLILIDMPVNKFIWNLKLPLNKLIKKGYYSLISRKMVREIIREYDIDVLFLYNIPQHKLMKGVDCLTVFDVADDYIEMLKHELGAFGHPLIMRYAQNLLSKMIRKADLTLAVAHVLAENIQNIGGRVEVLPNGADLLLSEESDKKDIDINRKPVVGFIGAFEYFIDFPLILDVAAKLPEISFLFVGGGREFKYVREQVKVRRLTNVVLTGAVPHARIYSYIKDMDICLNVFKKIPISHGACPIKLFEYFIMKKPVISTRLQELIKIDRDFIFFADTVDEYVIMISKLLKEKSLADSYAQRGYDIVRAQYNWDNITNQFIALLEPLRKSAKK